jgi:5'-3' exonuclease
MYIILLHIANMGIHNFSKVFEPIKNKTSLEKEVKDKRVVVDGFSEVYRAFLGMGLIQGLTNSAGESTQHINIILCNTIKIITSGSKSITWVFDTRASSLKDEEQEKRKAGKEKAGEEQKKIEDEIAKTKEQVKGLSDNDIKEVFGDYESHMSNLVDKFERLKTRTFKGIGQKMVDDIKFMLNCLGIQYINSPIGIEGEQIAGKLCQANLADIVITNDTDAPLFGCTNILKKIPKLSGKYDLYNLDNILSQHDITMNQLIKVGVTLGCDNAPKVPRVGPKTVINKVKSGKIEFTERQCQAIEYFGMKVDIPVSENPKTRCTAESLDELKKWLVDEQSFKLERMTTTLKPLYDLLE